MHAFFVRNVFISNARLKLAKYQANAKQHTEMNFFYLKIIHILHQRYDPKVTEHILKNKQKSKCVCIHEIIQLTIMKMKMRMKNRSNRYDINRPKPRYSKYKKCLIMILLKCI